MVLLQLVHFLTAACFMQAVAGSALYQADDNETACDSENLYIIGGHKVSVQDAPFVVALYKLEENSTEYEAFCGGSIIHDRFVLTAAHCIYFTNLFANEKPLKRVLIGSDRLNVGGMFIDVEQEFCHEGFGFGRTTDDICLLKLREPVPFGCKVAKAELPDEDFELEVGTLVNITGWGDIGFNAGMENELRQTSVPLVSDECCKELYEEVNATQLCAGSRGHDSCQGDSGGPMTYNGVQVGVVSFGELCSNSRAGVYTRVTSYLDWINSIIEGNLY